MWQIMARRFSRVSIVSILALSSFTFAQQSLIPKIAAGADKGNSRVTPPVPGRTGTANTSLSTNVYTIGGGDVLSIAVWKEKDLSPTVVVRPDGKISVPLLGEIAVTGLSPIQVEDLLRARLDTIVVNPRVTVTVVEIHSRMVYITGEVVRPGAYPLNTPLDMLQLIAQAGGLTEFASRKKIRLIRANATGREEPFDYNKMIRSNDPGIRSVLNPGDTVVVP